MADINVILKLKDQLSNAMAQAMGNSERSVKLLDTSMKGMTRTFANIGSVLAGGWIGSKVLAGIDKFSKAAAESEIAVAKLNAAVGGNTDALQAQANQLSVALGVDDEAIIRMQALLGGFTKNKSAIEQLTPAILDMAEALGMDMDSAARLVGKALRNDNDELAKYKIHVDGAAGSQERATSIANALSAAFGGQAKAANDASDKSKNVMVAMGNVAEAIGSEILPEVRKLNETLAGFANNTLVPFGKIFSHVLVDPFRIASIGAMTLAQGILYVQNASNKMMIHLQKEGSPMWKQYRSDIAETDRMIGALEETIVETSAQIIGLKEFSAINPKLPGGFDLGGSDKKSKTDDERARSAEETGKYIIEQLEAEGQARLALAEVNQQIADLQKEIDADKEARIQKHEDLELAMADRRAERDERDMEMATRVTDHRINEGMRAYQSTMYTLDMILKASKANATAIKAVRIAQIWMDAGMAAMASARSIWADESMNVYTKIGMSIGSAAQTTVQAIAATAMANKYSYATGTMYAAGGPTKVHRDETIYLPRGARVDTARQSKSAGVSMNVNIGSVTSENIGDITNELRSLGRKVEQAVRSGYLDMSRLAIA